MLPEHVTLLRELKKEDVFDKRPEVDEWLLQEYAERIEQAWVSREPLHIYCWYNNKRYIYRGIIEELNAFKRSLLLKDINGDQHYIEVETVYEVSTVEWSVGEDDFIR